MIKYKFKCDDCDGTVVESACDCYVEWIITGFDDNDPTALEYGSENIVDSDFSCLQCSSCGTRLEHKNGNLVQEHELYEWLKERGEL
jgi:hypothetical protein